MNAPIQRRAGTVARQRGRLLFRSAWSEKEELGQLERGARAEPGAIVEAVRGERGWRIERVLADAHSPLAAMYELCARHRLDPLFPAEVDNEVARWLREPGLHDGVVDLSALPFVTIDGEGTRDLDQALFVERDGTGFRAWYALADASYYVRPGTALFDEALRRGASYYLPGLCIPMLPRPLSEGIVSLNPRSPRRAMVFEIRVDARGRTRKTRLHRARIESRAQLTFAAVEAFLADPRRRGFPERGVNESLLSFAELGRALMADADRRDVVRYRRTECEVKLRGHPDMRFVLTGEVRSQVELYNEQLSLLCNVEGAKYLGEPEARSNAPARDLVQPIFRVHQPPDPNRYRALESLITGLVRAHRLRPEPWCWKRSDTSLADYLSALPEQGEHGRIARAIHRQAMLLNPRSWFSEEPGPHHGIGAEHYARFSSPMREIVGVFLHKEANEKLTGVPTAVPQGHPDDDELRRRIVARANEAKELQRQLTKEANRFVLDRLFEDELRKDRADRKSFAGTVMGISPGKVHVLLDDPPVEVKVYGSHLERLRRARLSFPGDGVTVQEDRNGNTSTLCRVGDAVRVTLIDRDRRGDRWVMRLGGNEGAP